MKSHFLNLILILLACSFAAHAQSQWQREFAAIVNGDTLSGAYSGGLSLARPKLVDIDADGDLDMFITNHWSNKAETKIKFYRNDGTPELPKWTFITDHFESLTFQGEVPSVNFVDIDTDGDFDILAGVLDYLHPDSVGHFYYYRNEGSPSSPHFNLVTEHFASLDFQIMIPTFVDIDADQDLDMFVAIDQRYLHFYRNAGSPRLPEWTLISDNYDSIKTGRSSCPSFCDIDDDGDSDMFINQSIFSDHQIVYYKNIGTPQTPAWKLESQSFAPLIRTYYEGIPEFADIDNDSDYDLFINDYYGGAVDFYRNQGDASSANFVFETNQMFNLPVVGKYPAFADIDGDGDHDLFMAGLGYMPGFEGLTFYRNDGDFREPDWTLVPELFDTIGVEYRDQDIQFVDIDADGDLDLFIGGQQSIKYYRNDGDAYEPHFTLVTDDYLQSLIHEPKPHFVDIDADGDYDMFLGTFGGGVYLFKNDGDTYNPHFIQDTSLDLGDFGNFSNPALVDWDNDGDYDLVVHSVFRDLGDQKDSGHVFCFRNDGTPQQANFVFDPLQTSHFSSMVEIGEPNYVFVDIDGDGDMDLFYNFNSGLIFYRNMLITTNVKEKNRSDVPETFSLLQNYPNPFNASTLIQYAIPEGQYHVRVKIYNLLGKEVKTLVDQEQKSGEYKIVWNSKDNSGKEVTSGIYFYQLKAGSFRQVKKLLLLR